MALINNYVSAGIAIPPGAPAYAPKLIKDYHGFAGGRVQQFIQAWTIAASDSAGSIYRIFPSIPLNYVLKKLLVCNDAQAGTTSVAFGLYKSLAVDGGAALNASLFSSGLSLAAAHNSFLDSVALNANTLVPQTLNASPAKAQAICTLWELLQETLAPSSGTQKGAAADLCMTVTTSGGVAGNMAVLAEFYVG